MKGGFKYTDFFEPKDISIAKCWMVIEGVIFKGIEVGPMQRAEMKKTFYMGFTECFKIINDLSGELTEDQACIALDRINREGMEFHDKILAEYKAKGMT